MPDSIPVEWIRTLTAQAHPDAGLTEDEGAWAELWNELHDLRLWHPVENPECDKQGLAVWPQLVRIHRIVGEHVRSAAGPERWSEIEVFLDQLTTEFEQREGNENADHLRRQHPWLLEQFE
ncbi:MAG: hypothetical protein J6386_26185 [Candidatus Synoicihabitans palmerolidicus]|nr:hypothetical protein [Candidatus Synoicihabitans palmerolidicus]MCC5023777.1 hypothetical protein [Candidatus Synoicihabitans palmerolidicus]MCC5023879.1 hypothetical protein [Candidatus Synoicihabitans palmerolidicus]MCC5024691.1 hypothetical protein [Candidatus Synoicihabitans palmerolidicus]MCC5025217.1 hypothetical protein [Candidatus Synoicihabitans palmerolidicus]